NKPLGVLEFLNRRDRPFVAQDVELISMLGREIGVAFEHIKLVRELEQRQLFHEALTRSLSAGLISIDAEGEILDVNPRARSILKLKEIKKVTRYEDYLSGYPMLIEVIKEIMASSESISRKEINILIRGHKTIIGYSGMPIINKEKKRIGTAILIQDITQYIKR
ncbi:hypothetical protein ACFLUV_03845, partial [Elusimicrobiota bacterium]